MNQVELLNYFKSKNITKVLYFHADHFEPWSKGINDLTRKGVDFFNKHTKSSKFGKRMSLFYMVHIPHIMRSSNSNGLFLDGDEVGFSYKNPRDVEAASRVIRPLESDSRHEVHLHIHHERWTRNSENYDNSVHAWVNKNSTPEKDSKRFELFLEYAKKVMSEELGRKFDKWAFVHGNWALNASDPTICMLEDEIQILHKYGCWGDFTFPAGRRHCDPTIIEVPYFIEPCKGVKVYDDIRSKPISITRGTKLKDKHFIIWNSKLKSSYSSIDYYSEANRKLFQDPINYVYNWIKDSVIIDDTMYLKTHSHSMKWEYELEKGINPIPHNYPDTVKIFDLFEKICDDSGVPIKLCSVNEIRDQLTNST